VVTAKNSAKVTKICGINLSNKINPKKIITPRVIVQKHTSMSILVDDSSTCFSIEKTRESVIKDKGKEKPKKNVFRVNLSMVTNLKYSLFKITRDAMIIPIERHNSDAWWNFSDTDSLDLKNCIGRKENFSILIFSTSTNSRNEIIMVMG